MALVVEDGTGLPDAESYASVEGAAAYAADHGLTFPASDTAGTESALRRATAWIDGAYGPRFPGQRKNGRGQALQWPQVGGVDAYGAEIPEDEVPTEIVRATIEAAVRELANPGALSPDVNPSSVIKSASVSGAVSVTYADVDPDGFRAVVGVIDDILSGLLLAKPKPGVAIFGEGARA